MLKNNEGQISSQVGIIHLNDAFDLSHMIRSLTLHQISFGYLEAVQQAESTTHMNADIG